MRTLQAYVTRLRVPGLAPVSPWKYSVRFRRPFPTRCGDELHPEGQPEHPTKGLSIVACSSVPPESVTCHGVASSPPRVGDVPVDGYNKLQYAERGAVDFYRRQRRTPEVMRPHSLCQEQRRSRLTLPRDTRFACNPAPVQRPAGPHHADQSQGCFPGLR